MCGKYFFLILFGTMRFVAGLAQFATNSCLDLRKPVYSINKIDSSKNVSYAISKIVPDYYSAFEKNCNSNTGCDNSNSSLVYDVYYPSPGVYNYSKPLPAIVLFHGGAFSDCTAKIGDEALCLGFAQRGFVAFNVEYRRGKSNDGTILTAGMALAIYRAVQDGKGALRSIIKRQLSGKTIYKIDTSKLFIGGNSAGAIIALFMAFYTQKEIDEVLPRVSDAAILGPLINNNYYGAASIHYSVKGILNMWGALLGKANANGSFPPCIKKSDSIPVISFHGEKDDVLPYSTAKVEFGTGSTASTEQCGFTYHLISDSSYNHHYGSEPIYQRLKTLDVATELYLDSDAKHGLDQNANYGLTTFNKDSVRNYIISRAAIFFQAVINKTTANIKKTKFEDEKNSATYCPIFP